MTVLAPAPRPAETPNRLGRARDWLTNPKYGPVIVTAVLLVGMLIAGALRYRGFTNPQVIANLFIDNAYLLVLAVGMTFVILTGGIDLSVGAVLAMSTMITASLLQSGWSPGVIIPLVLVLTSLLGLLVGLMIHYFQIQPFIATLAAMFLARGLCYVISNTTISITDPVFIALAQTRIPIIPGFSITPSVIIAVAVVVAAVFVLHYTRLGRTVYAIGGSEQSGVLMGLPTARTNVLVSVISGVCSGLAGVLSSFYTLSG